jgi:putative colanic acid biosynthesis acetyltransferase WcaF
LQARPQADAYSSSWSTRQRIGIALWHLVWLMLFRPSPKPLYLWRLFLLRLFRANIQGTPYIANSAIIKIPWHLTIEHRASLGPSAEAYTLGHITLKARCTIAQQAYLCTGTHDLLDPNLPLVTGPIVVGEDAFIGVRALVLPGVVIGEGAIVGGGSVVTRDVPPWTIVAGNPARPIGERFLRGRHEPPTAA